MKKRLNYWSNVYDYKKNTIIAEWRAKFIASIIYDNKDNICSILELGCNSGGNLLNINNVCNSNMYLCGIELSEEAVKYGKEVEKNQANLIVGSIDDLSRFEDNSFDLVFTAGVLLYLPPFKIIGVIKEMKRIAKKFIFSIEKHGKYYHCETIMGKDREYKVNVHTMNYLKAYRKAKISLENVFCEEVKKYCPNARVKNSSHIIWHNASSKQLVVSNCKEDIFDRIDNNSISYINTL